VGTRHAPYAREPPSPRRRSLQEETWVRRRVRTDLLLPPRPPPDPVRLGWSVLIRSVSNFLYFFTIFQFFQIPTVIFENHEKYKKQRSGLVLKILNSDIYF
jgi:hypothetical protein